MKHTMDMRRQNIEKADAAKVLKMQRQVERTAAKAGEAQEKSRERIDRVRKIAERAAEKAQVISRRAVKKAEKSADAMRQLLPRLYNSSPDRPFVEIKSSGS